MSRAARLLSTLTALLLAAVPAAAQGGRALRGHVVTADGASAGGMRVYVQWRAVGDSLPSVDSADVDSAGEFRVPLPARLPDSLTVIVDAADRARRTHHPSLARIARAEAAWEHGFVLAPREWLIPRGFFAGQRVAVSPLRARRPSCPGCTNGFWIRMAGTRNPTGFQGWPLSRFPLRVAFERGGSVPVGAVPDSAAFWRAASGVESALGMDVFRPVPFGQTLPRGLEEDPDDIVLVRVDRALSTPGLTTMVGSRGNVEYAGVALQRAGAVLAMGGMELVQHEMMHALGLGHTCAWPSVLADTHRCPDLRAPTLTPEDVAYTQLLYRVRDLQRDGSLRWGLDAAVEGERWITREPAGVVAGPGWTTAGDTTADADTTVRADTTWARRPRAMPPPGS
ncbi:hypothetical protein [Longimicrobium sp.]|uniref:hypothetical protein n=1 Tax=Longimicrobium sp. TaxID=2029185 RepID=UPI002E365011|nr:hypothetical protein [Longimicrobium sp.]HEX6040053.1 hypothetical protein [Longimicrobium sp.]